MRLILHQIWKDVLRLRLFAIVWAAALMLEFWLGFNLLDPDWETSVPLSFSPTILIAMAFVGISMIVHEDPVTEPSAFWHSRPVRGPKMLAAKLLLALSVFIVLPLLAHAAVLLLRFTFSDVLLLSLWRSLTWSVPLLIAFAVASVTPRPRRYFEVFFIVLVGGLVALMLLGWLATLAKTWGWRPPEFSFRLAPETPLWFPGKDIWHAVILAGWSTGVLVAAIVHQYFARRTFRTVLILLGGCFTLALPFHAERWAVWVWLQRARTEPLEISIETELRRPAPSSDSTVLVARMNFRDEGREPTGPPMIPVLVSATYAGRDSRSVLRAFASPDRVRASLAAENTEFRKYYRILFTQTMDAWPSQEAVAEALGGRRILAPRRPPPFDRSHNFRLAEEDLVKLRAADPRISGLVAMHGFRLEVVGDVPLVSSAALNRSRLPFTLKEFRVEENSINAEVIEYHPAAPIYPPAGEPRQIEGPLRVYALHHPETGEVVVGRRTSSVIRVNSGFGFGIRRATITFPRTPEMSTVWLDRVRLVLLEKVPSRREIRPFAINDFPIPAEIGGPPEAGLPPSR